MKAESVDVNGLSLWSECHEAIEGIWADPRNLKGGYAAWSAGEASVLSAYAASKIKAIEKKIVALEKVTPCCECGVMMNKCKCDI